MRWRVSRLRFGTTRTNGAAGASAPLRMTGFILTLALGGIAAAAVLLFVLLPMFTGGEAAAAPRRVSGTAVLEPAEDGARAIDALREIEFDRETGKLSDADYAALKATYTASALDELRRGDAAGGAGRAAAVLPVVRWTCAVCGPRPESDALFCSNCARYLPGVCAGCGAAVAEPAARYCAGCGNRLVA
jgi:hypothetical protein